MARQQESDEAIGEGAPRGAGELGAEEGGLATTTAAEREQTEAGAAELGGSTRPRSSRLTSAAAA